jgi:hypothetical protein
MRGFASFFQVRPCLFTTQFTFDFGELLELKVKSFSLPFCHVQAVCLFTLGLRSRISVALLALLLLLPFVYLIGLAGASLVAAPQVLAHLAQTILPDLVLQTV